MFLGNLDSLRDWGHARDYVQAMHLMLQQDEPGDYVIATGEQHSVREFVVLAFAELGATIEFEGKGLDEVGRVTAVDEDVLAAACAARGGCDEALRSKGLRAGDVVVRIDDRYYRPSEVASLLGDPAKANTVLGWRPRIRFAELVREMVLEDLEQALRTDVLRREGFEVREPQE
jgi:GDPmannose 4,6-dehydratase